MAMNLQAIFKQLDQYDSRIALDTLTSLLSDLAFDMAELEPHIQFDIERYQRNLIHEGPVYEARLMCWMSGHRSAIHDHTGSSCALRIIKGQATESRFAKADNGMVYPTESNTLLEGLVYGTENEAIHQISNLQAEGHNLISLHIYSPKLVNANLYSLTGKPVDKCSDVVEE